MNYQITLFNSSISLIELIGAVVGLIYLVLEYRASMWLWLFGVLMPICYIYLFFSNGVYANGALNVYNVIACIYGFLCWRRNSRKTPSQQGEDTSTPPPPENEISSMPRKYVLPLTLITVTLSAGIAMVLQWLGESETAWLDGISAALSCVAMWILAHKYYQQWLCWMIVNPLTVILSLRVGLYPAAVMYGVYSIVSTMGYFKWKKQSLLNERLKHNE